MQIKSVLLAAAFAAAGSQVLAGGFAPAVDVQEPVVVVEPEAPRSTFGILLPLLLVGALVAVAVANNDDDDDGGRNGGGGGGGTPPL